MPGPINTPPAGAVAKANGSASTQVDSGPLMDGGWARTVRELPIMAPKHTKKATLHGDLLGDVGSNFMAKRYWAKEQETQARSI